MYGGDFVCEGGGGGVGEDVLRWWGAGGGDMEEGEEGEREEHCSGFVDAYGQGKIKRDHGGEST